MKDSIRVMTQEEALEEFEEELRRLDQQESDLQYHYESGLWAMSPVYSSTREYRYV